MADRMAAEIMIGGPVPARLVPKLIRKIQAEGLAVGWEEVPFTATTAAELLDLAGEGDQPGTLHLVDHEAAWGQFDALEAFLVRHGIAFDRSTEAKYEYDAERVEFRPDMKEPSVRTTNQDGEPVMPISYLKPVRKALESGQPRKALQALKRLLAPEIPPLEPLRIVEETDALT